MRLFKLNRQKDPARELSPGSSVLKAIFRPFHVRRPRKPPVSQDPHPRLDSEPVERRQIDDEPVTHCTNKSLSKLIEPDCHDTVESEASRPPTQDLKSLWDRGYEGLKHDSPQLVDAYEKLIDQSILDSLLPADGQARQAHLSLIIEKGLQRLDESKIKYSIAGHEIVLKDQISQAASMVLWAKSWIGEAVKASPEASIAWAGVSIILPLLTNPSTAEEANRDGFTYVTTRMRYYAALETLLMRLGQNDGVDDSLMAEATQHVVALYQQILDFQIKSVLRFYRNWAKTFCRDLILYDNWKQMRADIVQLEAVVNHDLQQINDLASRQELESLNTKSTQSLDAMQQFLSVAKEHLRVAEDHLDISKQLLQHAITENEARERYQCHQLFRLTADNKDATYEWYKNRVEDRAEGTCRWFLEHRNFKRWLEQDSGPLLVSADPGCGKSVLSRYLIDHALPRSATICYFFFKDQDQNTITQALCAILHQLFSSQFFLIRHAMPEYHRNGPALVTATEPLWKILEKAVQDAEAKAVIMVLDALDECTESDVRPLAQKLKKFHRDIQQSGSKVKSLLTSRPYEHVISNFQELMELFPYIRIPGEDESETIGREINSVIRSRIEQLATEKRLSEENKRHLSKMLLEIPHRTYLWVHLVFDYLKTTDFKKTKKGIELAISTLPKSVNAAYEKILSRSDQGSVVRTVLNIILAANRPLTLAEMNVAVNVETTSGRITDPDSLQDVEDVDLEEEEDFGTRLRAWCGLFVSIHRGRVYLLHHTAKEFLIAESSSSLSSSSVTTSALSTQESPRFHHSFSTHQAHATLAEICVVYLDLFTTLPLNDDGADADSYNGGRYALLDYAAENWVAHFSKVEFDSSDAHVSSGAAANGMVRLASRICDPRLPSYAFWFKRYWRATHVTETPSSFDVLTMAAYFGHTAVVRLLLDRKDVDIEAKGFSGGTALVQAAKKGFPSVIELLLDRGADIEARDYTKQSGLLWAAKCGYKGAAQLLLDQGANVEARDYLGQTPLAVAAARGWEGVVKLLLEKGADVEVRDACGVTPLIGAAKGGHENVVRLLVNAGADRGARNHRGKTAMGLAKGDPKGRGTGQKILELLKTDMSSLHH
ncbi:hypothetical protein B0T19DRAFT_486672 [Cercophora scortea]|uniref:NWD NACHT-NTPase N-terminal domain-containing protein n=1 Tax=Cercophora scortea TaxID=314031 RepID=A0AAE0IGD3_9PEZI|nr:hypothetical protein B0T19DRAFT_486672 [Cercophora scortea]